ncbi:hypothetical protein ABUW04_17835 [Streptacidiphilus sp. N1-10]|uniref:Uncharacterized protein n=1 Tax=Streptacidiphilus jeojiensis TaxID=3229225 RepID=A0ABV6XPM2_9ACTN
MYELLLFLHRGRGPPELYASPAAAPQGPAVLGDAGTSDPVPTGFSVSGYSLNNTIELG